MFIVVPVAPFEIYIAFITIPPASDGECVASDLSVSSTIDFVVSVAFSQR